MSLSDSIHPILYCHSELLLLLISSGLSEISPRYRARIADRLDMFEDGMVDVVERLGKGLAGIQWWNSQSRVANMASIASRWSSERG